MRNWQYKPLQGSSFIPIEPGRPLVDQLPPHTPCCTGTLESTILSSTIRFPGDDPTGLYIRSLGGKLRLKVNGRHAPTPLVDHSSVGPIISLDDRDLSFDEVTLTLEIEGEPTRYSGLWEAPPVIGAIHELQEIRDQDWLTDRGIPLTESLFLVGCGVLLIVAYFITRKRFPINLFIGSSLLSASLYIFFLSSVPRSWSYAWGSALETPAKIILYWGLYLLGSTRSTPSRIIAKFQRVSLPFCLVVSAIGAYFGFKHNYFIQDLIAHGFLATLVVPLLDYSPKNKSPFYQFEYLASLITFLFAASNHPLIAFLWALSHAGIKGVIQHLEFFDRWKFQYVRLKRVERSAVALASGEIAEFEMNQFAKTLRRAMRVKRASIVTATAQGTYEVCGLSGLSDEAIGSLVNPNDHRHIKEAIQHGHVVITDLQTRRGKMWESTSCVAVPVPLTRTPSYLILLSDPITSVRFNRQDIPYMNQLSQVLWANMTMNRERRLRREMEDRFRNLVEKMDPHLHSIVTQNLTASDQKYSAKAERGLIYFDQKEFATLLEGLDSEQAEILGTEIAKWVSDAAQKHKGQVRGFYGDAYLLECLHIGAENQKDVALRTARILWDLSESVPELNKRLLARKVGNVKFRFGGHLGEASDLHLQVLDKTFSTLFGDSVNISQRLQSVANPGEIFVSHELAQYLADEFLMKRVPRSFVKGRKGFVEVYKVIGYHRREETKAS